MDVVDGGKGMHILQNEYVKHNIEFKNTHTSIVMLQLRRINNWKLNAQSSLK